MATVDERVTSEQLRLRLAVRIRELARRKGMGLGQLADAAGISRRSMWDYLSGKTSPTLESLAKLAQALEVDPQALIRR